MAGAKKAGLAPPARRPSLPAGRGPDALGEHTGNGGGATGTRETSERSAGWDRGSLLALVEEYLAHCYATRTAARVSELAFRLGVERWHLTRAFKRVFGVPPRELMRDLQLRRARELLIDSNATNEEIALATGFGTRNTFQRVFAAFYGVSPSEYRQSQCTK